MTRGFSLITPFMLAMLLASFSVALAQEPQRTDKLDCLLRKRPRLVAAKLKNEGD